MTGLSQVLQRRPHGDRGSATLELVILTPALLLFIALIVFAGRTVLAKQAVESAANAAARQASIARDANTAKTVAGTSADSDLTNQGLHCLSTTIDVGVGGFALPVGTPATVTATVTCVLNLSDLSVPGVPGTRTITAHASSPLDTYRGRG